ncbi:MAG TPA: HlyC/CorC family transporter [Acidobacteria bacterium]|nr:HlyC/CorC family transporter [Acidobacteriota bacterium]
MAPLLLFLIGCAVVYVASIESAFGAMVRLPARLTAERDARHESLTMYLEDPLRLYVVTRLLRGLLFATAAVVLARMIGVATPQAVGGLLLAMVLFVVVSEQLVPSALVRRDAGRTLELLLPSFDLVLRVVGPVTGGLLRLARPPRVRSNRGGVADPAGPSGETADPEAVADETEERKLLQSVVDFGGTLVREVMTPRPDIVAIAHDATVAEFRVLFAEEEYSRIPVYKDNLDNVLGFVFAKDLVTLDGVQGTSRIVPQLLRPAHVVPEGKRVAELLRELQVKQVQSAIVVDEYGGTAGLVTIEDLLEEIVGEIRDEYDDESEPIVDEGDGTFVFLATVSVGDMVERLGVSVERDGFETVGGYLLTRLGRVPTVGETLEIDGLVVEVLEAERRRVRKVRVHRRDAVRSAQ